MTLRFGLWLILNLFFLGCSSTPEPEPPPPPTIVKLEITSAALVNPDVDGKAAPVMLRIYELRETSSFNSADFFALFNNEQATLSADLVRKQELLIKPGDTKELTLEPDDDVRAMGFFAAFRQLDTAQWRGVEPVTAHQTQSYTVKLENVQLTVKSAEAKNQAPESKP